MNRLLAAVLLMVSAAAFSQSPTPKKSSTPSTKPKSAVNSNSQEFSLSDLLTNARLKVQKSDPCPDPNHYKMSDKLQSQAFDAKTSEQMDALWKKADEMKGSEEKNPCPIHGTVPYLLASGILENEVPGAQLMFPEQVRVECDAQEKQCKVLQVSFDLDQFGVAIKGPDETDYQIVSWDVKSLFATHDPDFRDKCHRSVLTISFANWDVSLSDIPTHEKGCEIFKDTNSYRLIQGNYYVDTTPNNDSPAVLK